MTTLTLNDDFLKSENLDNNLQKNIEKKAIISINKLELSQFTNYRLKTKNNQLDLNCLEKSLSSIKENTLDEILILEDFLKFSRKEVLLACRFFYRLLKNNGSIAIECPDLSKIISGIQASDQSSLLPGAENLISLIFGDVTSEDYLLPNKWGYSIHTLGMLLNQAGFSDFAEEMPLYSANNEHFFRISAKKL